MLGFYNYTVILTYLGMLFAFTGVSYALNEEIQPALICLILSGVCDMFDGKIASTMQRTAKEKKFGIQIDSLCDLISFGILPAIIVFIAADQSDLGFYIGGIYALCALIRLAYFNVDEEERQSVTTQPREIYLGLPVTTSAIFLPFTFALSNWTGINISKLSPLLLLVMSVAFLAPFEIKKPKIVGKTGMALFGGITFAAIMLGSSL